MIMMKNRIEKTESRIQDSGFEKQHSAVGDEPGFTPPLILDPESSQGGFSLISAIFLLVVIAALGTFAVTLSTTQQQSDALDVLGARGYQAARTGIEWAAFNVTQSPVSAPAAWSGCKQPATPALGTLGGNLSAFTVTVNCAAASFVEGASTIWIYDISAVAVTGGTPGSPGYIERDISAKMGR